MSDQHIIGDAISNCYFAHPPYRAELLSEDSGWAGVMNKNNINALKFKSRPGLTVTNFETATLIAEKWNQEVTLLVETVGAA